MRKSTGKMRSCWADCSHSPTIELQTDPARQQVVYAVPTDNCKNSTAMIKDPDDSTYRLVRTKQSELWQFCQQTTLHGLLDIARAANKIVRFLWLAIFLGALSAAVFGCYAIVESYLEAPIVASYFVKGMPEAKFALPDIVICPFNRFNAQYLRDHNISFELAQYMEMAFGAMAKHQVQYKAMVKFGKSHNRKDMGKAARKALHRLNMSFGQFVDAASLKCDDLIFSCQTPNNASASCCTDAQGLSSYSGKCYRISGDDQSAVGYGYGKSLVITLPKHLYTLSLNNWLNDGVIVKLAERNHGVDYGLTFLSVGTHVLMPLKAIRYEFINDPPHFECTKDVAPSYSRLDCFEECITEAAEQACNCTTIDKFNMTGGRPACTTEMYFGCITGYMKRTYPTLESRGPFFYECRQRCKPRCNYWQYESSISYANFPFAEAEKFAHTKQEWVDMKNSIILDVYYEKLEYTLIKHHRAMTVHGFIANLGGQYSLWLGGSILTLVQLVVFVIRFTYGFFQKKVVVV